MADLLAPLNDDQVNLLRIIYGPFATGGSWPTWQYVERRMGVGGRDTLAILRSLPLVGSDGPLGPRYSAVSYDRNLADDTQIRLMVAASLHLPEFHAAIGGPFVLILKTLIDFYDATPISPITVTAINFTRKDLLRARPTMSEAVLSYVPNLLRYEPIGIGSSSVGEGGSDWSVELRRELKQYEGIQNVRDYVVRVAEKLSPINSTASRVPPVSTHLVVPAELYIDARLIAMLEQKKAATSWNLDKLLQLIREFNDNHARQHPYACHALLRALIDHVPPIFGFTSFDQVVNNYSWPVTDKKYMGTLREFRNQADDVLHRPIRTSPDLITMQDLPLRSSVNVLLQGCIDKL